MLAGGLSGVAGWVSTYPMDVLKTRIQAQAIGAPLMYRGTWDALVKCVEAEGVSVLFRGLNATIVRAFPTNAVIFYVYALSLDSLNVLSPLK